MSSLTYTMQKLMLTLARGHDVCFRASAWTQTMRWSLKSYFFLSKVAVVWRWRLHVSVEITGKTYTIEEHAVTEAAIDDIFIKRFRKPNLSVAYWNILFQNNLIISSPTIIHRQRNSSTLNTFTPIDSSLSQLYATIYLMLQLNFK